MAESTATPLPQGVKDIKGQTFGRWLVEEFIGVFPRGAKWRCRCSCEVGTIGEKFANTLISGHSGSCGCLSKEMRKTYAMTHGGCYDAEYYCWSGMMKRCYMKEHKSYPRYGGAGVTVQATWHDYGTFKRDILRDIGPRPSPKHTLDRFPNKSGNYVEGNVRWATPQQQQRNMKSNSFLTYNGLTLCQAAWTEKMGWHVSKIKNRKRAGWSDERILSTP